MKKLDRSLVLSLAGASLFIGVIICSIGFGALLPAMYKLSAPLVCRGEFEIVTTRYNVRPGETIWQHNIYCTDENGKREVTFQSIFATGILFSLPIFAGMLYAFRNGLSLPELYGTASPRKSKSEESAFERLSELKKIRDADLIGEAEYLSKKKQIMDEM